MLKKYLGSFIDFYRYFISPLKPACCRYYPTCSRYALDQLKGDSVILALIFSILRILRCNPFFKGGIDYPKVYKSLKISPFVKKQNFKYFYIPCKNEKAKFFNNFGFKTKTYKNKFFLIKKL